MILLSVIICAHNPRADYLRRVLDALMSQTLPVEKWELLLVDNASTQPLAGQWDLSWHPHARHLREDELGLVPARLRGIRESISDLLIFVDDDNLLAAGYSEEALKISAEWPMLGAWGGKIEGEFEERPSPELDPIVPLLALRSVKTVQWSNAGDQRNHAIPIGAGMCVRRSVALAYANVLDKSPYRKKLDRHGVNLATSGDVDLAFTACDIGLGTGLFPSLCVLHLIPAKRIQRTYLLALHEEVEYGHRLLYLIRGTPFRNIPTTERLLTWYALFRHRGLKRDMIRSHWRARTRLSKVWKDLVRDGILPQPE